MGFIPLRWEDAAAVSTGDVPAPRRRELLEVSAVAIPANPNGFGASAVASGTRNVFITCEVIETIHHKDNVE